MNIKGLSEATLSRLIELGYLKASMTCIIWIDTVKKSLH